MGANTKIEWAHHTFNPWRGCSPVSEGCRNCYAARLGLRFADGTAEMRGGRPVYTGKLARTSASYWKQPLAWNKAQESEKVSHEDFVANARPRVFCASLADWLDETAPAEWLFDLITLIYKTPNLDWLLLTKRPENFTSRLRAAAAQCTVDPLDITDRIYAWIEGSRIWRNIWIGTTVENQNAADERIPHLLSIPARVRFLSCEPLLGPVEIDEHLDDQLDGGYVLGSSPIQWVICGGESGPRARPMNPAWARSLRDQCLAACVPFLFKQWGEWEPRTLLTGNGDYVFDDGQIMARVGRVAAGRMLDGRQWDQVPS